MSRSASAASSWFQVCFEADLATLPLALQGMLRPELVKAELLSVTGFGMKTAWPHDFGHGAGRGISPCHREARSPVLSLRGAKRRSNPGGACLSDLRLLHRARNGDRHISGRGEEVDMC